MVFWGLAGRPKGLFPCAGRFSRQNPLPRSGWGGTWEALEHILQRAGYFACGVRKIEAARENAKFMLPEGNRSRSFGARC